MAATADAPKVAADSKIKYIYYKQMSNTCFPTEKFRGLNFSDREYYKRAWMTFENVLAYNKTVTAAYKQGIAPYFKYVFVSYEEKQLVIFGQRLHIKAYPNGNWSMDLSMINLS